MMVMTVLEAQVAEDKWAALEEVYAKETQGALEPGLVQTFLLHGTRDRSRWRIATLWSNREALDAMRQSGETPRGVLMFRAAGAEPTLTIFEVANEKSAQTFDATG